MDAEIISRAIIIYTGRGLSPFPVRSMERLLGYFDPLVVADLAPVIDRLDEEFYEMDPHPGETLNTAADHAVAAFVERHSDLTSEAVDALRWCYTYDWK